MNKPAAATAILGLVALCSCTAPEILVNNAWVRTPPPGLAMTAAYLDLKNNTTETIILVGAASADFASVTLHESRLVDGVWTMTGLPSLSIATGETVRLAPGGLHLMMSAPQKPIARGDKTTIQLEFADGQLLNIPAVVHDAGP